MCHSDPLMTDGLTNEIEFGFDCECQQENTATM